MNSTNRQGQLKKRLFILAGYLFITAILLVYLSYSAYRIKIETTVLMPKTYTMSASIEENFEEGDKSARVLTTAAVELDPYSALVGLAPGKDAQTYAFKSTADIAEEHKFSIKVNNMDANGTSPCALDLYYTLEVETTGRLPLTFAIVEGEGDNAVSTASAIVDCTENEATTSASFKRDNKAVTFKLEGSTDSTNIHNIYIGWNNTSPKANDIDLCREVDKITIRAKIYAAAPNGQEGKIDDIIIYQQEEIVAGE